MKTEPKKVIIELSEHDALCLLNLIHSELSEGDKVWRTYWERIAQHVKQSIERTGSGPNTGQNATFFNNR